MIQPPALAEQPKPREVEYYCVECGGYLFRSTATWGKTVVPCRTRRGGLKCDKVNTIYFGGYQRLAGQEDAPPHA